MKLIATAFFLFQSACLLMARQPFESFQTPFSAYEVNPDSCIRIDHPSGSVIFIEAGGIQAIGQPVFVHYREHLTPLDMLIHGIPMHVQFGDQSVQLESSGMFELYAISGKDTLEFDSNKRMEVRLNNPKPQLPGTEGYRFDPSADSWRSYTSQTGRSEIIADNTLWGSPPIPAMIEVVEEDFGDGFGGFDIQGNEAVRRVLQTMEIDEFGFYNYDRIIDGLDYVYLKPSFQTAKNEPLKSTIYVVYDDINSIFYFPEASWEDQFFLLPNKNFQLFTVSAEGAIARLTAIPEIEPLRGKSHEFTLELSPVLPKTKYDVAQITGIQ